jgi:lipoprotein NlpD
MVMPARVSGVVFLLVLLTACSTVPINAPVGSRVAVPQTQPQPQPQLQLASTTGSADAQKPDYYSVRRGDTLYSIAWQNGLNFRQLAEMNAIRSPYTIYVGQSLRIAPADGVPPTPLQVPMPGPVARPSPRPVAAVASESAAIPSSGQKAQSGPTRTTTPIPAAEQAPAPEPEAEPALPAIVSRWVWPAKGPLLRGYTPEANGKKGIDIGGKAGQPIVSAADGKVVYAGSGLVGYGRLIIVKHNDSLLSAYGHNSELLVAEGDYVKAGQVIAKMGSSGTSSTRLYFEIRQDGKPVNPLRYLPHG